MALLTWFSLGTLATQLGPLSVPADNAAKLVAQGTLDLSDPLRWRATLRSDPLLLPWGLRYDVDLEDVQIAGAWTPVAGGMRVDYFYDERKPPSPESLRAGDRVEILARARTPRNFGDPGAFDNRTFLARQDIALTSTLRDAALVERLPGPPPNLSQRIARIHGRLLREVDSMLGTEGDAAAVARAMLLGDRSFVDRQQSDRFQQTGVYHVLALAGLHIGVLAAVLLWARRKLRLSLATGTLLTLAALAAYIVVVEDRPPILRAALMAAVFLLGRMMFRRTHPLNAVGMAAVILLALRPSELTDSSFLLSFVAAGTIAAIAVPLLECTSARYRAGLEHVGDVTRDAAHPPRVAQFRLDVRAARDWFSARLPKSISSRAASLVTTPCRLALGLLDLVVLTLVLQVAILPLMALYFHRVTLVGLAANIPAILLTGVIVPLGFLALGCNLLWSTLGRALGRVLAAAVGVLVGSVNWFARWPWASFRVPSPPPALLWTFFVVLVICAATILAGKRVAAWISSVVVLILAALIVVYPFRPRLYPGRLEVTVLDVGQGDSIFVAFPDGRTMLVDGGGLPGGFYEHGVRAGADVGEDVVSPFLWTRGLKRIDVVALTHAHEDHLGGLPAVLRNFDVGELWVGRDVESSEYRMLLAEAAARRVPVIHHIRGDVFDWAGVHGRVLWPADNDTVRAANNDDSLVLRLEQGHQALLLAGDIERPVETSLLRDGDALSSDFLKVPHHGSKTSSTEDFLSAVHPRFAAISVGEANPFGHPNAEVVDRIEMQGTRLYRTDRDGAITTLGDGSGLQVRTFLDPP